MPWKELNMSGISVCKEKKRKNRKEVKFKYEVIQKNEERRLKSLYSFLVGLILSWKCLTIPLLEPGK